MKFGQLVFALRKIIEIVATRCQILRLKCTKFDFGWGSALDPAGGAYSAPLQTVVIVVTVYMSIAVRNNMHFVLYHYCCEGRYCVNIHLKCLEKSGREKSGNSIVTGEWPAWN